MQVSGSFTVNVKPGQASNPVTIEPATGQLPDEQEGVAVVGDLVATVKGGVPPYDYTFSGKPDGMDFAEKDNLDGTFGIVITGTPAAGDAANSPYTIGVTVKDSNPNAASAMRSLTVR